ncbi:MAG: RNA polymerase sigma factor [Chitinophagales bacterium]
MSDDELIKGCIRENKYCQRALYERFAGKMMSVCIRYTRHRLEAEDILQEGFIKIFNNISKFQHKGSLEGWIRRIMINTALSNYNKSSFQKELIGIEDYQSGTEEPKAIQQLTADEIMAVINTLPDGYKIVFNLYVIEEYNHGEIAEMLDITPSTSRSQLVKARRMLQKKIILLREAGLNR